MSKYKVAIVGLGMVGLMYDHIAAPNETIYSHSKAFSMRPDVFELYGIDPSINSLDIFNKNKYGEAFTSLSEISELGIDIFVVAAPTSIHYEITKEILEFHPKILLMEKPISYEIKSSHDLVVDCERLNVSLFVNYFRRSLPKINQLRDFINRTSPKKCTCTVFYSGGVFNIASHFIDLLIYLFGDLELNNYQINGPINSDFSAEFFLKNKFIEASFIPLDVGYKCFEFLMFFDDFKVTFDTFGNMSYFKKGGHSILNFGDYLALDQVINYDVSTPQKYVVDEICHYLSSGSGNLCSGREALKTEALINQILVGV